jgi:hypothetical protein
MTNYEVITAYSEEQFNKLLAKYASMGASIYFNFRGAAEIYLNYTCIAVINKEY